MDTLTNVFEAPVYDPEDLRETLRGLIEQLDLSVQQHQDPNAPSAPTTTPSPLITQLIIDQTINLLNVMVKNGLVDDPYYDVKESSRPLIQLLMQYQLHITPVESQHYATSVFLLKLSPTLQQIDFDYGPFLKMGLKGLDRDTQIPVYDNNSTESALFKEVSDPRLFE